MKRFFLFLASSAFIVSCNRLADNEFEIAGTIDPSFNGKSVYLEEQGGYMGTVPVDTVKIENGKFLFKGTSTDPSLRLIQVEGIQGKTEIVLENGEINVEIDKDSLFKSKQSGTYNNDKLNEYYKDINPLRKEMMAFQKKYQAEMMGAYQKQDTVTINRINKLYTALSDKMTEKSNVFVEKNPKAFITVLLIKQMASIGKKSYAEIKKLYDNLDPEIKKTKDGKEVAELLEKAKAAEEGKNAVSVGKTAPDFSGPTPDGGKMSLKQAMGKVTIIDFWASWCKPCRAENPNVVAIYNELHSQGLNIIGVSLDKEEAKWKEAVAADKLTWNHVSNLKFWDEPIAAQYGVKSIPATFIVDSKGMIVAKDLRGEELKAKVKELLAVK